MGCLRGLTISLIRYSKLLNTLSSLLSAYSFIRKSIYRMVLKVSAVLNFI